jgi:hypothetical protein
MCVQIQPQTWPGHQNEKRKKKPRGALPFLLKAMDDPENLDACGSIAMKLPQDLAIEFLLNAELKGE